MGGQSFICSICGKTKMGDGRGHLKDVHKIKAISHYAFNAVYPKSIREEDERKSLMVIDN